MRFSAQRRNGDHEVLRRPDLRARSALRADRLHRQPVSEQRVVAHLVQRPRREREARRVHAAAVAQVDEGADLVRRHEAADPIGEPARDEARVVGEGPRRLARLPAAEARLQRLRQVPVVEGGDRFDAGAEQRVDEAFVEGQAFRVRCARTVGEDARPGDREPVRIDPEILHRLDVLGISMEVVAGEVAGVAVAYPSGRAREAVPDGFASSVLVHRAFDLVRRGGRAPQETVGEARRRVDGVFHVRARRSGRAPRFRRAGSRDRRAVRRRRSAPSSADRCSADG